MQPSWISSDVTALIKKKKSSLSFSVKKYILETFTLNEPSIYKMDDEQPRIS